MEDKIYKDKITKELRKEGGSEEKIKKWFQPLEEPSIRKKVPYKLIY